METMDHYSTLAEVFCYPSADYLQRVRRCQTELEKAYPEAAEEFEKFASYAMDATHQQREELFVKTFEVQALCYLDLGFVMFGEDHKRGMFLVHMKREHERVGNEYGTELPDHLANVLVLIEKTTDEEFRNDLVAGIAIPALRKMLEGFDNSRIKERVARLKKQHDAVLQESLNYGNVYQYALKALLMVLEQDFAQAEIDVQETKERFIPIFPDMGNRSAAYNSCSLPSESDGG
jgi:nitrate reductase assembly molybdenum cofactor insertion protein NarJ